MCRVLICDMSSVYGRQDFYLQSDYEVVDFSTLDGTCSYLDSQAQRKLRLFFDDNNAFIHFIDNGNYHYLSYLFLEKINCDFNLVLFDNHPDCKAPAFGDILSCGGWVMSALRDFSNLKKVYMVGVDKSLLSELDDLGDDKRRVEVIDAEDVAGFLTEMSNLPVYVSVDKDCMDEQYVKTNWDQGDMSDVQLLDALSIIADGSEVIGVDVCGEYDLALCNDCELNNSVNKKIMDIFQ